MTNAVLNSLEKVFGFTQFRNGQQQTVEQLLQGQSSLAIFPTGSGKSLCYQLTALHLPHLTLVVSPLLALMKDQLDFLAAKGIAAASIDSTLTADQSRQVMQDIRNGKTKILMVSVERFKNERFREFIKSVPLSMLVVDEAHCISEWGHNFRPDYLKLPNYRQELNIPLVLLLTATATKKVKQDMAAKFAIEDSHIIQTGFYRDNLDLSVVPVANRDKETQLLQLIQQQQRTQQNSAGIVYVTLQQSAEKVAQFLKQNNINASAYHAGFAPDKRQQIQADFMAGDIHVVVATIAFGMGIDKSDIRFVMHYDLPKSIENYSQEIGRAGRDGQPSQCFTLANLDGINTVENFVYGDTPELSGITMLLDNMRAEMQNDQWELQGLSQSNACNIRQLPLKTLLVQLELLDVITPLYAYFAEFKFKFLQPQQQILNRFKDERQQFIQAIFSHTDFKKVWGTLNFDSLLQAYGCDRGRVVAALEYLQEQGLIELQTKGMTEVFAVNGHAINNAELATQLYQYFADKEEKEIKRIHALVRFFQLDRCLSSNLARYFDDQLAPEMCGHCSVCRGQVAELKYSEALQWPADQQLQSNIQGLKQHLQAKIAVPISTESACRFLAGISIPIFARNKVKQLPGFGSCESQRYAAIREKVASLPL
ncbi:MAG: RecQ family ATP-dependent DNA helicase [Pseudomonadales bacterium]|nr:RecQ family ATP-dependent DNA helicase [Pseudomonadales bacterium]